MEPEPKSAPQAARTVVQPITAPLSRAAIFLTAALNPEPATRGVLRSFCADFSGLFRAVEFRNVEAGLSCVMAFGSAAWDQLFGTPRPAQLHPFREIRAGARHAPSTPGELLFHIRASTWICVSSLRRKSWRVLGTWFPRWMKCTAFETSMTAISSDLLTARRIPAMK
jgi:deferrochelatase/peroxidase EfeB